MKEVNVVAAIIKSGNKVLTTQRGYGDLVNKWEFPGGKIEPNETPEDALKREIKEELDANITVGEHLITVMYDYPTFRLHMQCFVCGLEDEKIELLEHNDSKWITKEDVLSLDWCPADIPVAEKVKTIL